MENRMNRLIRAAIIGVALATTAAPLAAEAQSRREHRQERRDDRREHRQDRRGDRREYRQERRDDRRDWRQGDYDNRREYRQDRRQDRREFREERRDDRRDFHQDRRQDRRWDRNNRDWWQGRDDFRDYRGARNGYWYAPSYGYYRVEPRYYGYRWERGGYLPSSYRGYYVRDPYVYGLGPAPRGYRYVYAGSDIVMIAIATGLIASVLHDVF
jgi:Ni/Co efflux regulator RcnB